MKIQSTRLIKASAQQCFDLLRDIDVHTYTSRIISGKAIAGKTSGKSELHDSTTWSAKFFGLRFTLAVKITEYIAPTRLVESLEQGLFLEFGHVYTCQALDDSTTKVTDAFTFTSPFGLLGRIFDALILEPIMKRNLEARLADIQQLAEKG